MKKTFSKIGIIVGAVIVVLGLYIAMSSKGYYSGTSTSSYSFGADFYTEQYTATEHAADNVLALGNYIEKITDFGFKVIGLFIATFGAAVICYFGCKLGEVNSINSMSPITVKTETIEQVAEELPEL